MALPGAGGCSTRCHVAAPEGRRPLPAASARRNTASSTSIHWLLNWRWPGVAGEQPAPVGRPADVRAVPASLVVARAAGCASSS